MYIKSFALNFNKQSHAPVIVINRQFIHRPITTVATQECSGTTTLQLGNHLKRDPGSKDRNQFLVPCQKDCRCRAFNFIVWDRQQSESETLGRLDLKISEGHSKPNGGPTGGEKIKSHQGQWKMRMKELPALSADYLFLRMKSLTPSSTISSKKVKKAAAGCAATPS